jgi:hypothetical protein
MSTTAEDFRPLPERGATPRLRGMESPEFESTPSLLRRLVGDFTALFSNELALLKAEMTEAIGDMKAAVVSIAFGGAVLFLGAAFLLLAAVYGLSNVVDPWLAALIVGGAVTLIGAILLSSGKRKLEPRNMVPTRTTESLRRDTELVKGVANEQR